MTMRGIALTLLCAVLGIAGCSSGGNGSGGSTGTPPPTLPTAATPTFSPASGSFTTVQTVTIADTMPGATIYYTTDGTAPTTSSSQYSTPISAASTLTITAMAAASGYQNSATAAATYSIRLPAAATPVFSPAPGAYTASQSVAIVDATAGAAIYYTTDGTTPTASSTKYTAPIAVSFTTTIEAVAAASGLADSAVGSGSYSFPGSASAVSVVLTTNDEKNLLAPQPNVNFNTNAADAGTNTIVVDSAQKYQTMDGFGAAFTDSAAYLLEKVAQPSQLPDALSDLFTRNGDGIGLSFMRNPMGASDLALLVYSFDDQPTGSTDPTLNDFSIAPDQSYIIPLILAAKKLNPRMKIMANPWSPPGWMKNTDTMMGGSLLPADYTAFAAYFVKYIQAYQAAGIPIDYISLQNEPLNNTAAYPSMDMDAQTELTMLRDDVLPALKAAGLSTQVLVYDHNWDTPSYPDTVLSDPTILASSQVAGTAWHGYAGTPGAQQTVQNEFPTKGTWMTEHSGGTWVSDQFTSDMLEITQVLRNSAKAYVKWSLALNEKLGPDLTQNDPPLGGCNTCTPIVTVNSTTGDITKDIEYYTLGQYSKYVLPGAVRIYSSNTPAIATVAFLNPDGSTALIAYNNTTTAQAFSVQWGNLSFSYTLPATAAATFTWAGTQNGTAPAAATARIQGSSYSSESGLETEGTSDTSGDYDLGYITAGAYALYTNVDFGQAGSVSTVNVRTASAGNGGTATFYLDSMTATPIATVTLPITGGWQTWQTVSAPVSSISGVHDLYVVFSGGGSADSISNLNWLQFQ
ncbi:MAG: chitobiase/beta-hexosaminidase C-terminal domain-containing protein [Acidobacteriaceae bacterium]